MNEIGCTNGLIVKGKRLQKFLSPRTPISTWKQQIERIQGILQWIKAPVKEFLWRERFKQKAKDNFFSSFVHTEEEGGRFNNLSSKELTSLERKVLILVWGLCLLQDTMLLKHI